MKNIVRVLVVGLVCQMSIAFVPSAQSIGSDLGASGKTYLYWVEKSTQVFQGLCEVGKPVLPSSCQTEKKDMPLAEFEATLSEGISEDVEELKKFIQETEAQLAAINEELKENPTPDLQKQKEQIESELNGFREKLKMAMSEQEGLSETLAKLKKSGVTYLVKADNTLYPNTRPFVKRFEGIFSGAGPVSSKRYMVSAGSVHTCVLDREGVKCWGAKGMGGGSQGQANVPPLRNPTYVAAGVHHTCAIDRDGVKCWGREFNPLPNPPPLRHPTQLVAGYDHNCALDLDGVKCWGSNWNHQLEVPVLNYPVQIAAALGDHNCAIDRDGVKCWGLNNANQTDVPPLKDPVQLSLGDQSCAVASNMVKCWGPWTPWPVPDLWDPVQVAAGRVHTCAIDREGVKCWGDPQLVEVPNIRKPIQISAGWGHTCALHKDGGKYGVKCWGNNELGQTDVPPLHF